MHPNGKDVHTGYSTVYHLWRPEKNLLVKFMLTGGNKTHTSTTD